MPQPILHLYMADMVSDQLRMLREPANRNAFLHGAIAPDVGYFPGGNRRLSQLAHHWRTAEMCRTLLRLATRSEERAFAWGWITHMLADTLLHPVINRWCAQQVKDAGAFEHLRLHVRLELGIDVLHVTAVKRAGVPTFQSTFDDTTIAYLTQAYELTYGLQVAPRALLRAHRNLEGLCRRLLDLEILLAGATDNSLSAAAARVTVEALRGVAALARGPRSMSTAFLNPILPPLELGLQLKERMDLLPRRFAECVATELRGYPDLDLDTGLEIPETVSFAVA